jgi:DUF4097 and DUF4098 domain-containing protein YvlB
LEVDMRRCLAIATLFLVFPAFGCTGPASLANHDETHSFAAAPGKLVLLDLRSLDVKATVTPGDAITVVVRVKAHASSSRAAKRWVERHTPIFEDSPTKLEVSLPSSGLGVFVVGFLSTEGSVEVSLPPSCRLEVRSASGDVSLDGQTPLDGPVRIDTASGDVTVRGGAGELLVHTASGDVTVSGPPLRALEAETASGDVRLDAGSGRALVDTASGDVTLRKLGGELSVDTSSGDVQAHWEKIAGGQNVRVTTSSGDVTLRIPSAAALSGEIDTNSGDIRSQFPGAPDRRGRRFSLRETESPGQTTGQASAGVNLAVRTSSGDIRLLKS